GGGWRTHAARAISVALVAAAVLSSFASPARADDPLTEALKRKEELERAVQVARQNTQRYQTAAGQFQAAINAANARIAALAGKQDEASAKEKEILGLQDEIGLTRQRLTVEKTLYDKLVADAEAAMDEQAQARAGAAADRNSAQNAARRSDRQRQDLQRQLDQAEAYYEQLAAAQAGKSGLGAFNGKLFMWPVRGPITSYFGPRWGGFHNGLDIAAPMYTPARAPSTGVVTTVGRPYIASGDTAVVVIIAHG